MADRRCEQCKGTIPNRMHRQRNDKGQMVCEECLPMNTPDWTTHSSLNSFEASEMRRRQAEALVSVKRISRLRTVAHDSGDNAIINHCPFCGSGAVMGGSDGTVTCDFCHSPFTVQVQPAHPFMPQTIDGQPAVPPGMPGDMPTEISAPLDPASEETEEGVAPGGLGDADPDQPKQEQVAPGGPPKPPASDKPKGKVPPQFAKGSSRTYATEQGQTLDEQAYMARLALSLADDRDEVLPAVRAGYDFSITCTRCGGEGDIENGIECPNCEGTGINAMGSKQASAYDMLAIHDTDEGWEPHGDLLVREPLPEVDLLNPYTDFVPDAPDLLADQRSIPEYDALGRLVRR